MANAVITGMGIVSCIGNSVDEVTENLKKGQSGIICLLYTSDAADES